MFQSYDDEQHFREAWNAVEIARHVNYSLFTFGESVLPYILVCGEQDTPSSTSIAKGEVRINRPMIVTPNNAHPEFENFFENSDEESVVQFLLARTAQFSNLKFANQSSARRMVSDGLQATVERLNRQLDEEEEDQVAILTAPPQLGNVAVLRYAAERVLKSGPDNIQELRERGFLDLHS